MWIDLAICGISLIGGFYHFRKFKATFISFWLICVFKFMQLDISLLVSTYLVLFAALFVEMYRYCQRAIAQHLLQSFYIELAHSRSFVTQFSYQINQSLSHILCILRTIRDDGLSDENLRAIKQRVFKLAHLFEELTFISDTPRFKKVDFINEFYSTIEELLTLGIFAENVHLTTPNRPVLSAIQHYHCDPQFQSVLTGVLIRISNVFTEPIDILVHQRIVFSEKASQALITIQCSEYLPDTVLDQYFNLISEDVEVTKTGPQTVTIAVDVEISGQSRNIVTNQVQLKRLLIVEDDTVFGKMLQTLFARRQCFATHVSNGKEALNLLKKEQFDLILCDIVMPKMSGLELAEIVSRNMTCAIQLMTGYPTNFLKKTSHVIRKPFDFDQLVYKLEQRGFVLPK